MVTVAIKPLIEGRQKIRPGQQRTRAKTCGQKGDGHQIWRIQKIQVAVASLRLFPRSSTGPNRRFQPQSLGRVRDPVRIAEGPTAIDAAAQRRHFGFRLRLVDKLQPIGGARQRPRREDGKRRVLALHTAQTRPTPRFRSLHEVCTQGVPLHVANDLVEVVFCFHRETLVTPLIEMAVPDLVTMLLPPFHMRVGHLLHERGKIAIPLGPNDKMGMVQTQVTSQGWLGSTPQGRRPQIRGCRAGGSLAVASSAPATPLLSRAKIRELNHA